MTNQERKQATERKYLGVLMELHSRLTESPRLKPGQFMAEQEVNRNLFRVLETGGVLIKKDTHLWHWASLMPSLEMARRACAEIRKLEREYKEARELEAVTTCVPDPGQEAQEGKQLGCPFDEQLLAGDPDKVVEVRYNEVAEVMEEVGRISIKELEEVQPDVEVNGKQAVEYYSTSWLWGLFRVKKVKLI